MISDPVDLIVAPLSNVTVSLFLPEQTPLTAYISPEGNFAGDAEMKADSTIKARVFLSGIMVDAAPHARALVTFGDSITDGANSTPDANHRWPDLSPSRTWIDRGKLTPFQPRPFQIIVPDASPPLSQVGIHVGFLPFSARSGSRLTAILCVI